MMTTAKKAIAVLSLILSYALLISGCKTVVDEDPPENQQESLQPISELQPLRMASASLQEVSATRMEALFKNGIRLNAQGRLDYPPHLEIFTSSREGTPINWLSQLPEGHAANRHTIFSSPYWFVSSSNIKTFGRVVVEDTPPGFHILKVDSESASFQLVNSVELDPSLGELDALFQVHDTGDKQYVSTLRNFVKDRYLSSKIFADGFVLVDGKQIKPTRNDIFYHQAPSGTIEITLNDVTDPEKPQVQRVLTIDGELLNVRQIGNSLYLVTEYTAWIDDLYSILGPSERAINDEVVVNTSLSHLLPNYTVEGNTKPLFDKCLAPQDLQDNSGHMNVLSLIKVDLATAAINSSLCFVGPRHATSTFTDEAFYFSSSFNDADKVKSAIYKIDLTQQSPKLIANGVVDGGAGPGLINTQLSVWNDELRVLSSERTNSRRQYYLTQLEQNENQLEILNQSHSSQWGLDSNHFQYGISRIYFAQDYLLLSDYALNDRTFYKSLSDTSNTHFTELLGVEYVTQRVQTLEDDLLLVIAERQRGFSDGDRVWVGVFQTADDQLVLLDSIELGGEDTLSSVWLPEDVSFFRADDHMRMVFPINFTTGYDNASTWEYAGLQFLEIRGLPSLSTSSGLSSDHSNIEILDAGVLKTESEPYDRYYSVDTRGDRVLVHEGGAYLYRHAAFWSADWINPDNVIGPVTSEINGCGELNPSVLVRVSVPEASDANACDTLVTVDGAYYSYTLEPNQSQGKSCVFSGPPNEMGWLDITGLLDGFKQVGAQVHASRDRCTSITETVSLELIE